MFKYQDLGPTGVPSYVGYGLGGLKGLKGLPDRLCNMVSLEICGQESCSMPFMLSTSFNVPDSMLLIQSI